MTKFENGYIYIYIFVFSVYRTVIIIIRNS